MKFELVTPLRPKGDQGSAIAELVNEINKNTKQQTLLGVTGSGKTFTIANCISQLQMPTLVISHNKTLAAQLYEEFREFFPNNAVEYFVSFYDYYQPEAYIPASDTYIEKTADINQEIDRLRLKATSSLLSRRDVIIVASVSCIYNIGSPESYAAISTPVTVNQPLNRDEFLRRLIAMHYSRSDTLFERGTFRIRGDTIELYPAYTEYGIRIETFGDVIERLTHIHPVSAACLRSVESETIFPAKHFISPDATMHAACEQIKKELDEQLNKLQAEGKIIEAHRLKQRTLYDIEMLSAVGFVNGIENYSRIIEGRAPGSRPHTLLDFFKKPYLTIIDESHASIPQINGMYHGDRSRKETLVEHGFRIPCALDNRPLQFHEFEELTDFVIYCSATPGDYELKKSDGVFVEQVIRPTGLVDPPIEIHPATNQIDDLVDELRTVVQRRERALVTTLTKKMAEDLTQYLEELGLKVTYLHSEIETMKRPEILHDLRQGVFDILVGINLLREGLDLPEVSLVAILDADKEGFLRSYRSLIQIAGRAARNINGKIVLYADVETQSIKKTLTESRRRRQKQLEHNEQHGIIPATVLRKIHAPLSSFFAETISKKKGLQRPGKKEQLQYLEFDRIIAENLPFDDTVKRLEKEMITAAEQLEFEKAAFLRDRLFELRNSFDLNELNSYTANG
ncbi:MAG: excinuclease ABC subunit UvrB [Chitinivibrionales bacterium]|nr:excinuclease ABC subunit UvrB [Chitinivibrionales bacterium]